MTLVKEIISFLEDLAPPALQESYDNSGLLTGRPEQEVSGILISLDCTEKVVEEAVLNKCNLIISHHPVIFRGLKSLTGKNYVERTVIQAIRNDIALYAIHTNLDNVTNGVNRRIAERMGLKNVRILSPKNDNLMKIISFVPRENTIEVLTALNRAGAGHIGNYENCSFRVTGTGTFQPNEEANPHIGKKGKPEEVTEDRLELIFPSHLKNKIVRSLKDAHPYEEVAYYLQSLENENQNTGSGMIGELEEELKPKEFLEYLKKQMNLNTIKFTTAYKGMIRNVAVCGGAGSFLLTTAKTHNADVLVSSDFKYHEFFDAEEKLMIADIGHYESEVFTKDLIYEALSENFTNFALHLSKVVTNPISYF